MGANRFSIVIKEGASREGSTMLNGKKFSLYCDGILARVIQHEYDHLQGIEFIEKISDLKKVISWNFYTKNVRNSKAQIEASKITKVEYKN